MNVYVITAGEYSGYHIVGVTLDKKFAEDFCKRRDGNWYEYRVEAYDTDDIECFTNGMHYWQIRKDDKGGLWSIDCDDSITYAANEKGEVHRVRFPNGEVQWFVSVVAEDREHAEKIGMDLITKYQYRKKVDEAK